MSCCGSLVTSIQRVTTVKLVEALKAENSLHLFVGSGSKVQVLELVSDEWLSVYHRVVLTGSVVYGIRTGPKKIIAIFGQKAVAIFQFDDDTVLRIVSPLRRLYDWIRDLIWLNNGQQYAVITAHNKLMLYSHTGTVISSHLSDTNCILYSAKILTPSNGQAAQEVTDLSIVAGTVFNTVILWSCSQNTMDKSAVVHSLSGHKGVIFDIDIHLESQHMCSVSDDRSIHLWHWDYEPNTDKSWSNTKFHLVSILNGHASRVWSAVLLDTPYVISIGEDGYVMVWGRDGSFHRQIKSHKSGSVWCLSVNSHHLVTAGANASVWLWRLQSLLEEGIDEISADSPFSFIQPPDFPRVVQLEGGSCFTLTDRGHLYGYNLLKLSGHRLSSDQEWSLVACTSLSAGLSIVALGTVAGLIRLIIIYDTLIVKGWTQFSCSTSKLVKLDFVKSSFQLMASSSDGNTFLYEVGVNGSYEISVSLTASYLLPKQKQWFAACACFISTSFSCQCIVIADMDGSAHLYKPQIDTTSDTVQAADYTLHRIHGKKGLTDMYSSLDTLHTIGRDGYYYKYTVNSGQLVKTDSVKISKEFTWLAKFLLDKEDDKLKVVAFHTTELLLYDVTMNYVVMRVDCGGGHRSWDFIHHSQAFYLAFIKNKSVQMFKKSLSSTFKELRPSFHTGKITCCGLVTSDTKAILVTGGDDGSVIGSEIPLSERSQTDIKHVSTNEISTSHLKSNHLYSHISSIKCMACKPSLTDPDCLLIFSGGGRAQLVASRIAIGAKATLKTLNVCSVYLAKQRYTKKDTTSADVRIMAISTVPLDSGRHILYIACSDGSIRVAIYNELTEHLCVGLGKLYEHTHCLLTANSTVLSDGVALLTVGATDGHIILLRLSSGVISGQLQCTSPSSVSCVVRPSASEEATLIAANMTMKCHQSGINALFVKYRSIDRLTIYSGGDDNCLVISAVDLSGRKVLSTESYSQLHSAQITGITTVDDKILTCSVDQRLHVWSQDECSHEWRVTGTRFMDIADVACITSHRGMIVVGGEGVEVLKVSCDETNTIGPK